MVRRLGVIAIALIALVCVAPAAASGPSGPVKIAGVTSFQKAIPYGTSGVLLLGAHPAAGKNGVTLVNLSGQVDRSFGDQGTVHIEAIEAAVAPDGKIVVIGTALAGGKAHGVRTTKARVTRLLPDGRIDRTFGRDGTTELRFGLYSYGDAVALAADGDVLVLGNRLDDPNNTYVSDFDLGVARLKPNGAPDTTFGHHGVKVIKVGDEIVAWHIAPTPSGGILIEEGNNIEAYLTKLGRNGAIDRHFGHGGYLSIEGRRNKNGARQLLLAEPGFLELADGKILVTATGSTSTGGFQELVGRYRADGRPDTTWGNAGWAVLPGGVKMTPEPLAALRGGGVAVAATFRGGKARDTTDFGAVAFNRRGRLDRKFAADGLCRASLAAEQKSAGVVAVAGRVVALGGNDERQWLRSCPLH
jgi:uncharacterized delta-60 repeat protein